jgi:ribosomal protein S18 acetylase RimI-like enzyme
MSLTIRSYDEADEAAVVALWTDVFGYTEARNEPRYALRLKHAHGDGLLLLALREARLLGTAMGGYDGHRAWLYSVGVAPPARRTGVGRALVRALEERLCARGAPKINLQIRAGNDAVIAFYEALGYRLEPHRSMGKAIVE